MNTMTKRQVQIARDRRAEAGLPVIPCPNCGQGGVGREGHWIPESLAGPGFWSCGRAA